MIAVSTFSHAFDNEPRPAEHSLDDLCRFLTDLIVTGVDDKRGLPAWSPCKYPAGTTRGSSNVEHVSCLVLDHDTGVRWQDASTRWDPWFHIIHTSWSHTREHHKFRVVLPLREPVDPALWLRVFLWAQGVDPDIDPKCKDPARMFFLPAVREYSWPFEAHVIDEEPGDWGYTDRKLLHIDAEALPPSKQEQQAKRMRTRSPIKVEASQRRREQWDRLKTDPGSRAKFAAAVGARMQGGGITERATGVLCPSCGKRSVWWLIMPTKAHRARCNHVKTCGWEGWLDQLADIE